MYLKKKLSKAIWYAFSDLKQVINDNEQFLPTNVFEYLPIEKTKNWQVTLYPKKSTNRKTKYYMTIPIEFIRIIDNNELFQNFLKFFEQFNYNIHILNFYDFLTELTNLYPYIKNEHVSFFKNSKHGHVYHIRFKPEKTMNIILYFYIIHFLGNILLRYSPSFVINKQLIFENNNFKTFVVDVFESMTLPELNEGLLKAIDTEIRNLLLYNLIEHVETLNNEQIKLIYDMFSFDLWFNKTKHKLVITPMNNLTKLAFSNNIKETLKYKYWFNGLDEFVQLNNIELNYLIYCDYFDRYETQNYKVIMAKTKSKIVNESSDFYVENKQTTFLKRFNYSLFDMPLFNK